MCRSPTAGQCEDTKPAPASCQTLANRDEDDAARHPPPAALGHEAMTVEMATGSRVDATPWRRGRKGQASGRSSA